MRMHAIICKSVVSKQFDGGVLGKKDIRHKSLEELNDVFADIVNVLLFGGKRIMKELKT